MFNFIYMYIKITSYSLYNINLYRESAVSNNNVSTSKVIIDVEIYDGKDSIY